MIQSFSDEIITVDPQLSEPRLSELLLIRTSFFLFVFLNYDIHWNFAVH